MADFNYDEFEEFIYIPFRTRIKTPGSAVDGIKTPGSGIEDIKTPGSALNSIGILNKIVADAIYTNKLNLLLNIQINSIGEVSVNVFGNKKVKTSGSLAKEIVTRDKSTKSKIEGIDNDFKNGSKATTPKATNKEVVAKKTPKK